MSEADDRIFLKRFSLVLVALAVFALLIIVLANILHGTVEREESAAREVAREQRLMPVAGVYAGETGRAAAMAAREAAAADTEMTAAFDGSLDGSLIYDRACASCHEVGAAGAPEMVASAWVGRVEKGQEQLVSNAINGIGAMPPRGGRRDLTDEQIEASVSYMLEMVE
ncbi:MAG: c-type cytochrome [Wenzhouxiangella sp.]